jgi:hypothetical protein
VRALLAYLATERGPHLREQLAELFWPERAEGSARNNLRHALAILRQAILDKSAEPPDLLITTQTIEFNPAADAWVDVAVFAAGADGDIAKVETQVALYRGPFLADITISGSAPLEDWLQLKREQFEEQVANRLRRFASSDPTVKGASSGIAFLPDGHSAISVSGTGQIVQWDLESGDERYLGRHDGIRGRVEVSPAGRYALTSGWNGELAYWDLETGEALRRFGRPGITFDIDMSPDGRYALTASSDRSVTLWDLSLLPATNLLDWISANRYVRELSCDEQVQYGIASSCP